MRQVTALLDACVLFSAVLRDLLMRLSNEGVFIPKWSKEIENEWINSLVRLRPELSRERLKRTSELMLSVNPDACITGYEHLIHSVILPDKKDRHVLAAAIKGKCDLIVTFNLKDFPESTISSYKISVIHPDHFISQCMANYPRETISAINKQQESLKSPPCSMPELLKKLHLAGLKESMKLFNKYLHL
jgi:predicted nucleic acid-binding protein